MAKKATSKPAASAAKKAVASPVIPAPDGPAQTSEQGMAAATSAVAGLSPLAVEPPAGGVGDALPQVPLSDTGADPSKDAEGASADAGGAAGITQQPAEVAPSPVVHPAIEQARSYITPHGAPTGGHHHYYTPPPPDLRSRKAKR